MGTSFHQPYTVFKEIQISTKIGYLPLVGLFPKLRTYKISPRHIDRRTCYQVSSRKLATLRA